MPATYFFLIDVSRNASKAILKIFADNLKSLIETDSIFTEPRT